jgi:hypothetical protein
VSSAKDPGQSWNAGFIVAGCNFRAWLAMKPSSCARPRPGNMMFVADLQDSTGLLARLLILIRLCRRAERFRFVDQHGP